MTLPSTAFSTTIFAGPRHWPARRPHRPAVATLRDGRRILCRRAGPDDADALVDLYAALSDHSRYTRFGMAMPRLTAQLRRSIADVSRGPVWVALAGDRCVGEARLVRSTRSEESHAAVTVADDHQHQGLGGALVRLLGADPETRRQCVVLTVVPGNAAALRLAQRHGFQLRFDGGVLEGRRQC